MQEIAVNGFIGWANLDYNWTQVRALDYRSRASDQSCLGLLQIRHAKSFHISKFI